MDERNVKEFNMNNVYMYMPTDSNTTLVEKWLNNITNKKHKAEVLRNIHKLKKGLFGNCFPLRNGLHELKIDLGPGYRVYFVSCKQNVMLICGGIKKHQQKNIDYARKHQEKALKQLKNEV